MPVGWAELEERGKLEGPEGLAQLSRLDLVDWAKCRWACSGSLEETWAWFWWVGIVVCRVFVI